VPFLSERTPPRLASSRRLWKSWLARLRRTAPTYLAALDIVARGSSGIQLRLAHRRAFPQHVRACAYIRCVASNLRFVDILPRRKWPGDTGLATQRTELGMPLDIPTPVACAATAQIASAIGNRCWPRRGGACPVREPGRPPARQVAGVRLASAPRGKSGCSCSRSRHQVALYQIFRLATLHAGRACKLGQWKSKSCRARSFM
jgi:hypothetical protein